MPRAAANDDTAELRQLVEILQDKVEELEVRGFEGRTIAKALAAVAAEQLHQVGGTAYFLESGMVSMLAPLEDGRFMEVGLCWQGGAGRPAHCPRR
jgi:hypothetical protein